MSISHNRNKLRNMIKKMSTSSQPSAAYMCWWTKSALVRVWSLSEPMLTLCQLDPLEQTSIWILGRNTKFFIHENAFENVVCEMVAILSRWEELFNTTQIARFMGPTWGPAGSCRPQMGPTLAPWILLSGNKSLAIYEESCCGYFGE